MALHKLTALKVDRLKKPGRYGDGGGLWLNVSKAGTKSWVFRFMINGRSREMGLGAVHTVSLKMARDKAHEARVMLDADKDPLAARDRRRAVQADQRTFRQCAEAYLEAHESKWSNTKHRWQWENTLKRFAYPVFGDLLVAEIEISHVERALKPIWTTKTETATRLRGRIEAVLAWATVKGYRKGDNPATWKNNLDKLFPAPSEVRKVQNLPALPYADLPKFIVQVREQPGIAARALEFAILTAARTGEIIGAKWPEIDFDNQLWTVPADRMKAGKEHRVPLTERALAILREMENLKESDFVFPGGRKGKPMSNMAMNQLLKRMEVNGITVHGFRSTFRDWAAETTDHPREVQEHALAHRLPDKVEAAYQRGDLLEKRRVLMNDWMNFAEGRA